MTLRDIEELRRRTTIEAAVRQVGRMQMQQELQQGSYPDASDAAGFYEQNDGGELEFQRWFRAGDAAGSRKVRPW